MKKLKKATIAQFITWFLASFFFAFQMTLRVLPAILMDDLMERFNLSLSQFGVLAGLYYVGYAGFQIPIGALLDKFHPRYVIAASITSCAIGVYLFAIGSSPYLAYLARFLIGVGSIAGILGSVKAIDDFFPKHYNILLGFTILIGVIGAYYGGSPVKEALQLYSYEEVLYGIATLGLILAGLILVCYAKTAPRSRAANKTSFSESLQIVLSNRKLLMVGIFGGLMVGPLEGFADVWAVNYLSQIHHISKETALKAATMIFFGFGIGGPIIGYISEKVGNYERIVCTCGVGMTLCFLILFSGYHLNLYLIYAICLVIGLFSTYQIVVFAIANKMAPNHLTSIATSTVNMLIMIFGMVFHSVIGTILEKFFEPVMIGKIRIFSETAYHSALSSILFCTLIGACGYYYLSKILPFEKRNQLG